MARIEFGRDGALNLVGDDVSCLEFLRRQNEKGENNTIVLVNGARLAFVEMLNGKELYELSGTEEQVSAHLNNAQVVF